MQARSPSSFPAIFELAKVLPEAVLLLSERGEVLAANSPAGAMLGLDFGEVVGRRSLYDLSADPAEDVERRLRAWSRVRALSPGSLDLKAADGRVVECRCDGALIQPREEGSAAVIFLRCVPRAESNGRFLQLNSELEAVRRAYHEISQIKERLEERVEERTGQLVRSTEQLRESREWFRSIIRNTSDVVWVAGADATLSYASPSVERTLGYTPGELVGTDGFALVHPDDLAEARSFYSSVLGRAGGDVVPAVELRLRRADGSWCPVEFVGVNLLQDPAVRGVVFNARDVGERKRAEEENDLLRNLALEVGEVEDLDSALSITLQRVCEVTGWAIGQAWVPDRSGTRLECSSAWYAGTDELAGFRAATGNLLLEPGAGLPGLAWSSRKAAWTRDITKSGYPRASVAGEFGLKAGVGIPVLAGSEVVAVLDFFMFEEREKDERLIGLVSGAAAQLGSVVRHKEAEGALRESEARHRAVVDTASDAIMTMSEDGIVRSFNPGAELVFGYGSEEVVGRPLKVLMPERLRASHEAGFRRYLGTGEAHVIGKGPVELTGLRKNGEEFPLELSLGELRTEDGSTFTGIIRDVTERRRAQEALRRSEERFRRLVDQAADALFVHDLEGRFVNVNQQACESLGYSEGELLNLSVADVEEKFSPEEIPEFCRQVFESGPLTLEGTHRRKDGTRFPVEVRVGPFEAGENRLMLAVARDITERKQVEQALRASEAGLAEAQRISHLGSWEIDLITGEMSWSDEMYRVFGFAPGEIVPTREVIEEATHPEDRALVPKVIRSAIRKRRPFNLDHRVLQPDGGVRFIQAQGEAVFDSSGKPVRIVGTSLDITERKRAEEELRKSESRLRAAQRIASVGNWSFDVGGNKAFWSEELYRIFGLNPQEEPAPTYRRFLARVHPDDRALVREAAREALQTGTRTSIDYRVLRPDGEVRFVHSQYEVRHGASGEAVELIGTLQDVTRLRRAEAELREQARILDLAPVLIRNPDDEIMFWNTGAREMYGWSAAEALGQVSHDLLLSRHPEPPEEIKAQLLLRGSWEGEISHTRKDGTTVVVASLQVLHRDEYGKPRAILEVNADVTERKRVEEGLRRSEARNKAMLEASPDLMFRLSRDGVYLDFQTSDESILYVPAAEIIGKNLREVLPPDLVLPVLRCIERTLDTGEMQIFEYQLPIGGQTLDFEARTVVSDPDEVFAIVRNVTERKRTEASLAESEEKYRTLIEQIPVVTYIQALDHDNRTQYISPQVEKVLGYTAREYTSDPDLWIDILHPDDRERVLAEDERTDETLEPYRCEYRMFARDGSVVWVQDEAVVVRDAAGRPRFWQGVMLDVTEGRIAGEALRRSEERFRSLVQNASDVVAIIGADGTTHYVSPPVERVLGYGPEDLVGASSLDFVHSGDLEKAYAGLARILRSPAAEVREELRVRHADGSWRCIEAVAKNLIDDPAIGGIVVNYRDVTERKVFERQLEHQAFHDELTDLPNRTLFVKHLERELATLAPAGGGAAVAVLFVDLDNFKVVNDSLGHAVGDLLLVAVARRLRSCIRTRDTVARFGGDEFAVLLTDLEEVEDAVQIAKRISSELQTVFVLGGREVFVSPSIGISLGDTASDQAEDLLREADTALYRAKALGKARYAIFDSEMHATVLERLRLEGDLRQALERDEFRVHYQPKMRLIRDPQHSLRVSGSQAIVARKQGPGQIARVEGTEALIRWEHPDLGLVSPAEFIPVAEETGLIVQIGRWVLKAACLRTRRLNDERPGEPPLTVCVNLSARQFHDPDLFGDVAGVLRETGLDPRQLCLEITESAMMQDVRTAIDTLRELKALGVRLAVDDFGTGYSSLAYLKRFPVDYLKIDRSFVGALKKDTEDTVLVAGIIRLAHTLDMQVVAEGVESEEQLRRLQGLGCDFAQGFYFSRPLPEETLPDFLADDRWM